MSGQSLSLRHVPAETIQMAEAIARQTGLSLADVYRLALASGLLVEASKLPPDGAGSHAGLDGTYLAKALRRQLAPAIDLLLASGEHPSVTVLATQPAGGALSSGFPTPGGKEQFFDATIGDDLANLGMGLGLAQE